MKVSYVKGLATTTAPSHAALPVRARRSVDRGKCGLGIEPRNNYASGCRRCKEKRKATTSAPLSREAMVPREVGDPRHARKQPAREPGDPVFTPADGAAGRIGKSKDVRR